MDWRLALGIAMGMWLIYLKYVGYLANYKNVKDAAGSIVFMSLVMSVATFLILWAV